MKFYYLGVITLFLVSCNNNDINRKNLIDFVPYKASIILKSSNIESLKNSVDNNYFLQEVSQNVSFKKLNQNLNYLTYLQPLNEVLLCFSKDSYDSLQYIVITKYHNNLVNKKEMPNYIEETSQTKNNFITKYTNKETVFYSSIVDSVFIASSSKDIITSVFNQTINTNAELTKLYNTFNNDKTCSVIVKSDNALVKSLFIENALSFKQFTNYLAADIDITQNRILINGVTKAKDSLSLVNIFKNTVAQVNQIQNITPVNSDGFLSFTFHDFQIFKTNLNTFRKESLVSSTSKLFDDITEVGVLYEANNRAVILHSVDALATKDALLAQQNTIESYRDIAIYSFSEPALFAKTFSPLISFNKAQMYCVLDNFFVFSDNKDTLFTIIANYQNNTTLGNYYGFQTIKEQLSDASSLIQVVNPSTLKSIINDNLKNKDHYNFSDFNVSALQFIYDTNFAHVHAVIKKSQVKTSSNTVSEQLNIKLDKDLLNTPQFVTNHITKEKEIIVQDVNNNLYLISNKGKVLWKKPIQGAILGHVEQLDIYKNGKLQLCFATANQVYVIDRNGKDVAPFPVKFNNEITQPLSVFDYDKNKNYRLLVTQNKTVLMYDVNAKIVSGFKFQAANSTITSQPKHFRINTKDYIAFKTLNKLYLLDRTGKTRIVPKSENTYSNQPIYLYNNTFATTGANGNLICVDTKGNVSNTPINLTENHAIDASSKTLVTFSENRLSIKNKTTELDFGDYSKCKFFYYNDKIYISITDLQSHKIYIFDSQSNLLDNFPVYGNSSIDLSNIDTDKNLEFVAKGESNSIILYQIN